MLFDGFGRGEVGGADVGEVSCPKCFRVYIGTVQGAYLLTRS